MTASTEYQDSIRFHLLAELPSVAPGLTKSAYVQIVDEMMAHLPKHDEEFEKFAAAGGFGNALAEGAGTAIGKVTIAALAGAGLYGIHNAMQSSDINALRPRFEQALSQIMSGRDSASQMIRSYDKNKVKSFAETIFSYGPHVAADINVLKTLLANALSGDGLDPSTLRSIQELERNRKELSSWKPADLGFKG